MENQIICDYKNHLFIRTFGDRGEETLIPINQIVGVSRHIAIWNGKKATSWQLMIYCNNSSMTYNLVLHDKKAIDTYFNDVEMLLMTHLKKEKRR